MDLHRLRTFFQVVQQGGFTAAARRLGLSQPSVSLQIKALEEELGSRLLERKSRRIVMTPHGELLYELAERIFDTEAEILTAFSDRSRGIIERLTIATNQSVAAHILPPILDRFTELCPSVEVNIHNMSTAEIVLSVSEGSTQIGIILIDPRRPGLAALPVAPYEMVLVTPRDHPLSRLRRVTLEDILEHPFISYTRDTETRRVIDHPFQALKQKINVRMALGSTDLIIKYVSLGYGISIIHNLNIDEANRENLHIRPMKRYYAPQFIHLIYRDQAEFSPAARAFRELLEVSPAGLPGGPTSRGSR